jgi:serine/threonine protein kinase
MEVPQRKNERSVSPRPKGSPSKSKKVSSSKLLSSALTSYTDEEVEAKLKELNLKKIWINVMKDYELIQHLGQGSFGQVVEGRCRISKRSVAIKLIADFSQYEYDCVKVIREIQIMRGLH